METITTSGPAAFLKAGNSLQTSIDCVATAWVHYCNDPSDPQAQEVLARALEQALIIALPINRGDGLLKGREKEIRQEANLLLLQKYLVGNHDLLEATRIGDSSEIVNQILKSINGAIVSTSRVLLHAIQKERKLHEYRACLDDNTLAICVHAAHYKHLWQLPYESQKQLVFEALRMAIKEKFLRPANAKLVMKMVENGTRQSEVANSLGITKQAIHQRIAPVRNFLRSQIPKQEFPLS
jgi:hypothetical protein